MRFLLSVGVAVVLTTGSAEALGELAYQCHADVVTGLYFDEATRSWQGKGFSPFFDSYVIRPFTEQEKTDSWLLPLIRDATRGVFAGKSRVPLYVCPDPVKDHFDCKGIMGTLVFDGGSQRYQSYSLGGYVIGHDDNENTPSIEIGRCTELR